MRGWRLRDSVIEKPRTSYIFRLWARVHRKTGNLCGSYHREKLVLYIYVQRVKVLVLFSGIARI